MKRTEKFKLGELFEAMSGNIDIQRSMTNGIGTPVVSSGLENSGIIGLSDIPARIIPANTITIDMFGHSFYRDYEYKLVTHARIFALIPKYTEMNSYTNLYVVTQLMHLPDIFSYAKMCTYDKVKDMTISLPILTAPDLSPVIDPMHAYSSQGFIPDFAYMEHYIAELEAERVAELEAKRVAELEAYLRAADLNDYELTEDDKEVLEKEEKGEIRKKEFKLGELFEIKKVYGQPLSSYKQGLTPYVTGSETNNGVIGFVNVSEDPSALSDGNCIAIDPIKGFCKYQSTAFVGRGFSGASINLLYHKDLNENNALYICAAIEKTSLNKASYSKLLNSNKLNNTVISLPIDSEGNICFAFMEKYIKAIEKLSIAGVVQYKDRVIEETKKLIA